MKLNDELFRKGQAEFVRGTGIRTMVETVSAMPDEDEALSLAWGYADGLVGAIRATHNLLSQGAK